MQQPMSCEFPSATELWRLFNRFGLCLGVSARTKPGQNHPLWGGTQLWTGVLRAARPRPNWAAGL